MRPPSRWLAPGAGTAMPPPPRPSGGGARGPEGPPHPPPPPPSHAQERTEANRRNGGPASPPKRPLHPGCGGTTAEAGARTPCPLPAEGGPAAPRTAQTERPFQRPPGEDGGANQGGGVPPPSPPPPCHSDPLAADRTAPDARGRPATPTARVYPGGARRRQQMAGRRPTGRGGGGGGPPTPPPAPAPPPKLGSHRSDPPPPRSRGGAPPPPEGSATRGGGGCRWTYTPRAPAPPAACSRGGRGRQASPHQRAGATRGPSLGAAHGGAPEQYGGCAPHDPPMTTAHSGRAEGGFRSAGAPGGAVHGPPLIPPRPRAAPRPRAHAHAGGECADSTRGPGWGTAGRHPEGEQGGRGATPAPHPPHRPASRGGPCPHPPRKGGWSPLPPPDRGAGARPAPPAPAAGSHRNCGEQASPRQRARTPHTSLPVKAGGHEPEWY